MTNIVFENQNWIGEKVPYWCRNESLWFKQKKNGPLEKYIWAKCQQEGGLPPWWTIHELPECIEKTGNNTLCRSLMHRGLLNVR